MRPRELITAFMKPCPSKVNQNDIKTSGICQIRTGLPDVDAIPAHGKSELPEVST
jgi:hypothetical protein